MMKPLPHVAMSTFVTLSMLTAVQAQSQTPEQGSIPTTAPVADSQPKWTVLVGDRASDKDDARWRTVISDGKDIRIANAPLIVRNEHVYRLEKKMHNWKKSFYKGKTSAYYSVEELQAKDLETGKSTVIVSATKALAEAKECVNQGCYELQNPGQAFEGATAKDAASRGCSYDRRVTILSLYDGLICLHDHNYSNEPFSAHPNFGGGYEIYQFDGRRLKPVSNKFLTRSVEARAKKKLHKMEIGTCIFADETNLRPECFVGCAVIPAAGGLNLEYAVTSGYGAHYDVDDKVSVPLSTDSSKNEIQRQFVKTHRQFLNWKKTSFFSAAPDGSGVVYKEGGTLFFKRTSDGKVTTLASVHNVRGLQWVPSTSLKKTISTL